jgi:hypothetical protein
MMIEEVNQALPVVTVLSLTSFKPGRIVYPVETFLSAQDTGLAQDSIAMAHQPRVKNQNIADVPIFSDILLELDLTALSKKSNNQAHEKNGRAEA